jgi:hypothetical protein
MSFYQALTNNPNNIRYDVNFKNIDTDNIETGNLITGNLIADNLIVDDLAVSNLLVNDLTVSNINGFPYSGGSVVNVCYVAVTNRPLYGYYTADEFGVVVPNIITNSAYPMLALDYEGEKIELGTDITYNSLLSSFNIKAGTYKVEINVKTFYEDGNPWALEFRNSSDALVGSTIGYVIELQPLSLYNSSQYSFNFVFTSVIDDDYKIFVNGAIQLNNGSCIITKLQ